MQSHATEAPGGRVINSSHANTTENQALMSDAELGDALLTQMVNTGAVAPLFILKTTAAAILLQGRELISRVSTGGWSSIGKTAGAEGVRLLSWRRDGRLVTVFLTARPGLVDRSSVMQVIGNWNLRLGPFSSIECIETEAAIAEWCATRRGSFVMVCAYRAYLKFDDDSS